MKDIGTYIIKIHRTEIFNLRIQQLVIIIEAYDKSIQNFYIIPIIAVMTSVDRIILLVDHWSFINNFLLYTYTNHNPNPDFKRIRTNIEPGDRHGIFSKYAPCKLKIKSANRFCLMDELLKKSMKYLLETKWVDGFDFMMTLSTSIFRSKKHISSIYRSRSMKALSMPIGW